VSGAGNQTAGTSHSNEENKPNMKLSKLAAKRPTRTFPDFFKHVKKLGFNPATVIDVGVAKGTPPLYEAFPNAYFILAEPVKDFVPHLEKIVKKYRGEYHLCALMSESGTASILKTKELHGSSMMHRVADEADDRLQDTDVKTLDEIIGLKDREGPILLKTDCQGGDFEVVRGGIETLKKCELIILEVSLHKFWGAHHPDPLDILNFMADHGFVLYDFLDGLFRPVDNALGQIDMVFVRRDGMFRKTSSWN
jgi:FkbM family methyltransferase